MSIGAKNLRSDSRWHQFTEPEQVDIRRIYERQGTQAAAAHCRKIGKPWSRVGLSEFFRRERARSVLPRSKVVRKARSDSRWWQFTELERAEIRRIQERDGLQAASAYCGKIAKPWSATALGKFFSKEREARLAEETEIRKDVARLKALREAYEDAGMDITEATAFYLAQKLRDAVKISEADPNTAVGRAIIQRVAPYLIALRALRLRESIEAKRMKAQHAALKLAWARYRFSAAEAVRNNFDKVREVMAGSGNDDEKTEALGRLIFGERWDK
jgi:hypothetical protein